MASWGDVQVYDEMIADLGTFYQTIGNSCEVMLVAAQTCMDNMESDKASVKAYKSVTDSVKKYEEARELAAKLARALEEERNDLIEYLRKLDELEAAEGGE